MEDPAYLSWEAEVRRSLKGASIEERLVFRDEEGRRVEPLYLRRHLPPADTGVPGAGRKTEPCRTWAWIDRLDPDRVQEAVEAGAHGLVLVGPIDPAQLRWLPLGRLAVSLRGGGVPAARALLAEWSARGVDGTGVLGLDPRDPQLVEVAGSLGGQRGLRLAVADGAAWSEAGACLVDQLALVVAGGLQALRRLEEPLGLEAAFARTSFRLALGSESFEGIAAVRALRGLWARVAELSGLGADPSGRAFVHVLPAARELCRDEAWTNALRGTATAFAALLGGADAVTLAPFDQRSPASTAQGRRLACTTPLILGEEAGLGQEADAAAGSFFLESRTAALMEAAWERLQQLEAAGGPAQAQALARTWCEASDKARRARVARRSRSVLGVSQHARPGGTSPGPIDPHGLAAPFEALRDRAVSIQRRSGHAPAVGLVLLGTPASRAARRSFTEQLLATGGVLARPAQAGDRLVVLCGSDEDYAASALEAARAHGVTARVLIAGRPAGMEQDLAAAGVSGSLYLGCDVVAQLDLVLRELET